MSIWTVILITFQIKLKLSLSFTEKSKLHSGAQPGGNSNVFGKPLGETLK